MNALSSILLALSPASEGEWLRSPSLTRHSVIPAKARIQDKRLDSWSSRERQSEASVSTMRDWLIIHDLWTKRGSKRSGFVSGSEIRRGRRFDTDHRKGEDSATRIPSVFLATFQNRHILYTYPYHGLFQKSRPRDISECTFHIFRFETGGNFLCGGDISFHSAPTWAG